MGDDMKQAILTSKRNVEIKETDIPSPNENEVLIELYVIGVCGSDVHYYTHGKIGRREVIYPHIQGHECSGIVVKKGGGVTNLDIGDRVVVEPSIACLSCEICKKGNYNLCENMKFISTPPF